MKTLFLRITAVLLLFTACNSNDVDITQEQEIDMSDFFVYTDSNDNLSAKSTNSKGNYNPCSTMDVLNRQLRENPSLEQKMYAIEYHTRKFLVTKGRPKNPGGGGSGSTSETDIDVLAIPDDLNTINIPVYVHIVLPNPDDVTDGQVQSQIDVLNADFNNTNANLLPSGAVNFVNDATITDISFTLTETFRHEDSKSSWGTNDAIKATYPPITPETHLNIWVCNIGRGILGYAQFPGGDPATDGIVLLYSSLPDGSAAPYNLGRTATHEIGHYLNLRHIWGDGRCRQDDFVEDTPSSDGPNYGCPNYPTVNCKSTDMTMNYMDYTDDACMYMFTDGQRNRMRAIFASGGPRAGMVSN
ncbi:zinc metalloprotease [Flavobacteriaceae bacterium GSB9]|nr:zinc metalloprotease [Flavobacteriaceae bacterium GSB9]